MSDRNFRQMLEFQWSRGNFVCVGLDSEIGKIPTEQIPNSKYMTASELQIMFNHTIVEATKDIVCAYKPNAAFYEACGAEGIEALHRTIADIHNIAPDVPVILDAKRGDIGNTNAGYVKFAFDYLRADAITVYPYLGAEALEPFLARAEKGVIVLCRTSNPGAGEFQDLSVNGEPLYRFVARRVANEWNKSGNCALVVGATYPGELREVRGLVGDMPLLIPGVGFQQKDIPLEKQIEQVVSAGEDSRGQGMIINSSRGIIFSDDPRYETKKLRNLINQHRLASPGPGDAGR